MQLLRFVAAAETRLELPVVPGTGATVQVNLLAEGGVPTKKNSIQVSKGA
jgi:hypothetical protein